MRSRIPSRKAKWWQRWSRRKTAPAHASDAVVTARLARTVTITTALFTTLAGITGTIATAVISYKNAASQLAAEREKSTVEFLRKQRQEAYKDFGSEINATYVALTHANRFFWPSIPPPTLEDFNRVHDDLSSHVAKLSEDAMNLDLVASEDVCAAANRNYTRFTYVANRYAADAAPYVEGQKPPDDYYRKIWMTENDFTALQNMTTDFTRAAREDISDPALRKPAKNCS